MKAFSLRYIQAFSLVFSLTLNAGEERSGLLKFPDAQANRIGDEELSLPDYFSKKSDKLRRRKGSKKANKTKIDPYPYVPCALFLALIATGSSIGALVHSSNINAKFSPITCTEYLPSTKNSNCTYTPSGEKHSYEFGTCYFARGSCKSDTCWVERCPGSDTYEKEAFSEFIAEWVTFWSSCMSSCIGILTLIKPWCTKN